MANDPPFATLNHFAADLGIPSESDLLRIGINKPMTSFRQIEANRGNALKSTGPKTEDGKRRSRRNAVLRGSTAETVIVALEDIEDYQALKRLSLRITTELLWSASWCSGLHR
jgi:hypothetical protein